MKYIKTLGTVGLLAALAVPVYSQQNEREHQKQEQRAQRDQHKQEQRAQKNQQRDDRQNQQRRQHDERQSQERRQHDERNGRVVRHEEQRHEDNHVTFSFGREHYGRFHRGGDRDGHDGSQYRRFNNHEEFFFGGNWFYSDNYPDWFYDQNVYFEQDSFGYWHAYSYDNPGLSIVVHVE